MITAESVIRYFYQHSLFESKHNTLNKLFNLLENIHATLMVPLSGGALGTISKNSL